MDPYTQSMGLFIGFVVIGAVAYMIARAVQDRRRK